MVAKIDLATRSRIKALLPVFSSNKELLENMQKSGKGVSLSSVERIRREEKQKSTGWTKPPKKLPAHMRPNSKKKRDVKAVDKLISSPKTGQWLVDHKFSYIPQQNWLSNSPDLAPMDYAINYVFKKFLNAKVVKSRAQLVRSIRTAWSKVQITVIRRALLSWKRRVGMMLEKFGYQYEQEL